jgi:inorganic pyrophosphatase
LTTACNLASGRALPRVQARQLRENLAKDRSRTNGSRFYSKGRPMPSLTKLETYDQETGHLNIIIETPQGSRNKYAYDPKQRVFKVKSLLPKGMAFPYDFGFIPSTLGDDGDPLDVLVLMEAPAPGGLLVPGRIIGVIEAEQSEDGKKERNDRLIAVSVESHCHAKQNSLDDLSEEALSEIEQFFVSYNVLHGKKFKPLGRRGPEVARKLIKEGASRWKQKKKEKESPNGKAKALKAS